MGRVRVLLAHYFEKDMPPEIQEAMANDWLDVLEPFPQDAIDHACRSYLQSQPSRRPTPADIRNRAVAFLDATRPKPKRAEPFGYLDAPKRDVIDGETAQRILHQAGFTEDRLNLVKRFPSAPGYAAAEAMSEKQARPHWSETADPDGPDIAALQAARDENPLIQAARAAQARAQE